MLEIGPPAAPPRIGRDFFRSTLLVEEPGLTESIMALQQIEFRSADQIRSENCYAHGYPQSIHFPQSARNLPRGIPFSDGRARSRAMLSLEERGLESRRPSARSQKRSKAAALQGVGAVRKPSRGSVNRNKKARNVSAFLACANIVPPDHACSGLAERPFRSGRASVFGSSRRRPSPRPRACSFASGAGASTGGAGVVLSTRTFRVVCT